MGSMPKPCFKGAEVGSYAKRHNPFLYFPSIANNPSLCAHDLPESELNAQLTLHHLPTFSWIRRSSHSSSDSSGQVVSIRGRHSRSG